MYRYLTFVASNWRSIIAAFGRFCNSDLPRPSSSEGIWCAVLSKRYIKVLLFIRPIFGRFSASLSVEFLYFPHTPHQFSGRSALPDVPEKGSSPESVLL